MQNTLEQKVYYSDTDAYGVVWHGSYLRWMEMGRISFCEQFGHKMSELDKLNIVLPVVNIDISYKSPAKLEDEILIETKIKNSSKLSITFEQIIKNKKTKEVNTIATVKIVAVDKNGKLYRALPDILVNFVKNCQ